MEAKELRLGNLVYKIGLDYIHDTPIPDYNDKEIVVVDLEILENILDFNHTTDFELYEPIPLIEEKQLLDFGFNNDYKDGYIGIDICNSDFVLTKPFKMGEWQDCFCFQFETGNVHKFREIKYIHDLQNFFFSLYNEELKFKQTT